MMLAFLQAHAALLVILVGALVISVQLARADQTPLIVDGLFAALVIARPSLAALGLLVMQAGARRVPIVARGLATFGTLPPWLAPVLLPGASTPAMAPAPAPAATGATVALPTAPAPLPLRDWLNWANHTETAPHLAATGPTRSGKTTLILAVLWDRPGDLVICTPKAASTDPWGGFPAVRLHVTGQAISYAPIVGAIRQVYQEMLRRNAEDTILQDAWLTLVIDELTAILAKAPEVRPLVQELWTLGASARIRVIVLSPEENVKAWGIEGRGDIRDNLVFIRLDERRQATMRRWNQTAIPIDIREVKKVADGATLAFRAWRGLSVWSPPAVCPSADDPTDSAPQMQTDSRPQGRPNADDDLITYLQERSYTREQARAWLAVRHMGLDNNRWRDLAARRKASTPPVA